MKCHSAPLPWLDKPRALRNTYELILASAASAGGFVGYFDLADGAPSWRPPQLERKLLKLRNDRLESSDYAAPADWLERSLSYLAAHRRSVTAGTFLFVLSDFIPEPPQETWIAAFENQWDVIPVVVQDPTWEQSFPEVNGIVVSLRDARTGRLVPVRLSRKEVRERRHANCERLAHILGSLRALDLDPILVSSSDPAEILGSFLAWTELRRARRVVGA
jgi:hypothetical protein